MWNIVYYGKFSPFWSILLLTEFTPYAYTGFAKGSTPCYLSYLLQAEETSKPNYKEL